MITAAALTAVAVALAVRSPPTSRLHVVSEAVRPATRGRSGRLHDAGLWSSPRAASGVAGLATAWLLGGVVGVVAGAGVAVVVHRWVASLESAAVRRRRERVERDLPVAVDLIVAALAAGRPPERAVGAVGSAIGGPLGEDFATITAKLDLGADPVRVWQEVATLPAIGPLGRAFARTSRTGASVTVVLGRCADDLRARRRAESQRVARSAGVRTAAPLGACFLPAFIIVGIAPTLFGMFQRLVG